MPQTVWCRPACFQCCSPMGLEFFGSLSELWT